MRKAQSRSALTTTNDFQPLNYAKRDAEAMRDWSQKEVGFDRVFLLQAFTWSEKYFVPFFYLHLPLPDPIL